MDGEPLYIAALAGAQQDQKQRDQGGFVIITTAAENALLDIHDRKPLVLRLELAKEWLDPATASERAFEIIKQDVGHQAISTGILLKVPWGISTTKPRND